MQNVRTYVQSGNVVLDTRLKEKALTERVTELLRSEFELDVPVVTRTRDELAAVVELNPLGEVATEPKRYQVTFLSGELDDDAVARIASLAMGDEVFTAHGRELFTWHPEGVARSKLALGTADKKLGLTATARNWTTVTTLLDLADAG